MTRAFLCSFALALAAAGARADCFAPLAANRSWKCSAEVPGLGRASYCLRVLDASGSGADRTFGVVATGAYRSVCTCGAGESGTRGRFDEGATVLCVDKDRDAAWTGRTSRSEPGDAYRLIVSGGTEFTCEADPACLVDLP